MTDLFGHAQDATELSPQTREGLRQSWITYRRDLNEAEEENIVAAAAWARRTRDQTVNAVLNERFVRTLHRRMFGDVWDWAGKYRNTELNIGIESHRIPTEIANLLGDLTYWVANETYPRDEIGVRLHHRLVSVHPFPNGNGRHSRLMADLLVERLGGETFSWGNGRLIEDGALRGRYIAALQAADGHDIDLLLVFARS